MTQALPIGTRTMPLADAARALRCSYAKAHDLLVRGHLDGERDSSGRWQVSVASVDRVKAQTTAAPPCVTLRSSEDEE